VPNADSQTGRNVMAAFLFCGNKPFRFLKHVFERLITIDQK